MSTLSCATAPLNAAKECLNRPVTYVPRQKDYSLLPSPQIDARYEQLRANMQQLSTLMQKDRLNVGEIKNVRQLIEQAILPGNRSKYYEALQEKVIYASQRDNWAKTKLGEGSRIESKTGEMCNVTALAMAMKYLGITVQELTDKLVELGFEGEIQGLQYEDMLEYLGQISQGAGWQRTVKGDWSAVAALFGVNTDFIDKPLKADKKTDDTIYDWYQQHLGSALAEGKGVMISYNGHIVRVQAVTADGLVVDDPFGGTQLKNGKMVWADINSGDHLALGEKNQWNEGEDHVLPWKGVRQHTMLWMGILSQP